jgi:hypothetical protein
MSQIQKTRLQHATALPYPKTPWASVSPETEQELLSLLLPVLEPVGQRRRLYANSPGGSKKRKLDESSTPGADKELQQPDVAKNLSIGLTSTYRQLNAEARPRASWPKDSDSTDPRLMAIFMCREALPDPLCQSLPLLVAAAAAASTAGHEGIRIVPISQDAEQQVASALGLPRAAMVGVRENTPNAGPLAQYVRTRFATVADPLRHLRPQSQYLPVKIEQRQVLIPPDTKKSEKSQAVRGTR